MSNYIINFTDPLKGSFIIRPYTSNGPKFPTTDELNDTSTSASSTLLLYGKGHPEYGERTDENLLNLLENFSGASEPVIKVAGMLWHKEVLYYYDNGTVDDFYVYNGTSWDGFNPFGTGALPGTPPVGLVDGDYWYDNTGSPTVLYQWSADERNIDDWIVRIFDEDAGAPTADPLKELQIYDGDAWDVLPDLTVVNDLITTAVSSYLLLDTSNGPLTGDLDINKANPIISLTGSDPILDLVGTDPILRFRGDTNWQISGLVTASPISDVLEFRVGAVQNTNTHFVIDNQNDILTHGTNQTPAQYKTNIAGVDNAIPNKLYVDGLVSGAITGDTFIDGGTFGIVSSGSPISTDTGTLTMPYSTSGSPGPSGDLVIPGFDSDQIPFVTGLVGLSEPADTVDDALTKAAPIESPSFTGAPLSPNLIGSDPSTQIANKGYVDDQITAVATAAEDSAAPRSIATGGGTTFSLPFTYTAGYNRLMVFKNGVKQYKDELASSTLDFGNSIFGAQTIFGLGPITGYVIVGVDSGADTWTIAGTFDADFTVGDTFDVADNAGSPTANGTYTVVSAAATPGSPSPGTTDIVVTAASIPGSAGSTGNLGINYNFVMTLDGVGPSDVVNINRLNIVNFDDLVTEMQAAIDTTFGSGLAYVYLFNGNIKVESVFDPGSGSPQAEVLIVNGPIATSDLFDSTNLGVDGFLGFIGSAKEVFSYFESDGGSPPGNAPGGQSASEITFNAATLGTDKIEFLLVR